MGSDWTNGKPRYATAEDLAMPWDGYRDGRAFRCTLCGDFILIGEEWRFVYTGGTNCGAVNFFAHTRCCGSDPIARMVALIKEAKHRFWWLRRPLRSPAHPESPAAPPGEQRSQSRGSQ